jgi:heptosyltransferase-1
VSSPRILIVRTSALGDVVHALPILSAVRSRHDEATLGWVVEEAFAPLLANHPLVDVVIPTRLRAWRQRPFSPAAWRELMVLFGQLHEFGAEIVLDLMGNHKAGVISALTLADRRIGLARRYRREPSSAAWVSEPVVPRGKHAVNLGLSLAGELGAAVDEADFAGDLLPEEPTDVVDTERRVALLHPFTGWPNKDYPLDSWAAVARSLAAAGIPVVIAPGPGEEQAAAPLTEIARGTVRVIPALSLPQLVFLQRRAAIVLGGDTGPVHLAHALGTPVVCVMGPTDPSRNGPYGAPELTVSKQLECSFCHKKLPGTRACLLEIAPETVVARALEIVGDRLH